MPIQAANVTTKDLLVSRGKDSAKALSQADNKLLIKAALKEYTGSFEFADFPIMEIYGVICRKQSRKIGFKESQTKRYVTYDSLPRHIKI